MGVGVTDGVDDADGVVTAAGFGCGASSTMTATSAAMSRIAATTMTDRDRSGAGRPGAVRALVGHFTSISGRVLRVAVRRG